MEIVLRQTLTLQDENKGKTNFVEIRKIVKDINVMPRIGEIIYTTYDKEDTEFKIISISHMLEKNDIYVSLENYKIESIERLKETAKCAKEYHGWNILFEKYAD